MFLIMIIPSVQEKDRDKREKDKEGKEKDKKIVNGHVFTPVSSGQAAQCSQCNKTFNSKEAFHCTCKYYYLFFFFLCFFSLFLSLHFLHCLWLIRTISSISNQSSLTAVILHENNSSSIFIHFWFENVSVNIAEHTVHSFAPWPFNTLWMYQLLTVTGSYLLEPVSMKWNFLIHHFKCTQSFITYNKTVFALSCAKAGAGLKRM